MAMCLSVTWITFNGKEQTIMELQFAMTLKLRAELTAPDNPDDKTL